MPWRQSARAADGFIHAGALASVTQDQVAERTEANHAVIVGPEAAAGSRASARSSGSPKR